MSQARYWLLTIPASDWSVPDAVPSNIQYLRGQRERGAESDYEHWQLYVIFKRAVRLRAVKRAFCDTCHAEATRSAAAEQYVWKESTAIPDTQFERGSKPLHRNDHRDWDAIRAAAIVGDYSSIPSDVFVRNYNSLRRITADHMRPTPIERSCTVFWGRTGLGKSHRAWAEAGFDAYPKDPRTKFWDGYQGQQHVVMDEFRGAIDVSHMLRWLDKYPVIVEVKGSSVVLKATTIWITSNLHPKDWYKDLDEETRQALLRRLEIVHFDSLHQ